MEDKTRNTLAPKVYLNWDQRECVQPANIKRIPLRCLHELPSSIKLRMIGSSVECLFKLVDNFAGALGGRVKELALPEGLKDKRRVENILTLNLLWIIDRVASTRSVQEPPAGYQHTMTPFGSTWDQETVLRDDGWSKDV